MRVLIAGGGIAGLTSAYWLSERGVNVVVAEQAADHRNTGYAINLVGGCLEVLRKMNLSSELDEKRLVVNANNLLTMNGKPVRRDDISDLSLRGSLGLFLRRVDLHEAIRRVTTDRADVRMGQRVNKVSNQKHVVDITFEDGREESFDFMIGADGLHSHTRSLVCGEGCKEVTDVNYAAFIVEDHYGLPLEAFNLSGPGKMAGLTGLAGNQLSALFWWRRSSTRDLSRERVEEELSREFSGFGWIVTDVLRDLERSKPSLFCDYATFVKAPKWHEGRVGLVGDAAYCLSPLSLKGAGMAIVGSFRLANALADSAGSATAFERYEAELRPEIQRLQSLARKNIGMMLPTSGVQLGLRNVMMKLIPEKTMKRMMIKQFASDGS